MVFTNVKKVTHCRPVGSGQVRRLLPSRLLAYPPPPSGRLMMFTAANIAIPSCNQAQDVIG